MARPRGIKIKAVSGTGVEIFREFIDGSGALVVLNIGPNPLTNGQIETAPNIAGPYALSQTLPGTLAVGAFGTLFGLNGAVRLVADAVGGSNVAVFLGEET